MVSKTATRIENPENPNSSAISTPEPRNGRNMVESGIPAPQGTPVPYYQSLINSFRPFGDEWRERGFGAKKQMRQFFDHFGPSGHMRNPRVWLILKKNTVLSNSWGGSWRGLGGRGVPAAGSGGHIFQVQRNIWPSEAVLEFSVLFSFFIFYFLPIRNNFIFFHQSEYF